MNYFFDNLVTQLSRPLSTTEIKHVSKKDYEVFCKEFIFDSLQGTSFGLAFCKKFEIIDAVLLMGRSDDKNRQYIKDVGYVQ